MFSLGLPHPWQCREHQGPPQHGRIGPLRLTASYIPGSQALARGRSCLCGTNGINQNKRQRACFYLLPIQGFKMHLQTFRALWRRGTPPGPPWQAGKGRASRAHGAGARSTGQPFAPLCPWAALLSPCLGSGGPPPNLSQLASPLHCTPSPFLQTSPVPSHPPVRDDATEQPGHVEQREDEERVPAPARNSQRWVQHSPCSTTSTDTAGARDPRWRIQQQDPAHAAEAIQSVPAFSGLLLLPTESRSSRQLLASPSALPAPGRGDAGGTSLLPSQLGSARALPSKQTSAAARTAGKRWFINALMRQQPGSSMSGPMCWREKLAPSRYGQEDLLGEGTFVARGCCETPRALILRDQHGTEADSRLAADLDTIA